MSRKRKTEDGSFLEDESPSETVKAVEETKSSTAPVKDCVQIVLTGAASYSDLALNLGPFRKGQPVAVEAGKAETLLATGLFKKA